MLLYCSASIHLYSASAIRHIANYVVANGISYRFILISYAKLDCHMRPIISLSLQQKQNIEMS